MQDPIFVWQFPAVIFPGIWPPKGPKGAKREKTLLLAFTELRRNEEE